MIQKRTDRILSSGCRIGSTAAGGRPLGSSYLNSSEASPFRTIAGSRVTPIEQDGPKAIHPPAFFSKSCCKSGAEARRDQANTPNPRNMALFYSGYEPGK